MERTENKVAGFGCGDGERDCFQVAHFTHHDDIRVLPEGAAQCRSEGFGVGVHFPLVHLAAPGGEEVFDRILQGDDVFVAGAVHFFDQRGKGRALAAANRAGNQNEPVLVLGQHFELRRQTEFVHRPHVGLDDPENKVVAETVAHHAGAVTTRLVGVGKVNVTALLEEFLLRVIKKAHGESLGVGGREFIRLQPDRLKGTEAPPGRLEVDAEVDI